MRRIIYPGTFDPIHNGHIDIAARASKLFDELIFVVAVNADKNPLLTAEERVQLILDSTSNLTNVTAQQFTGLVVNYAQDCDAVAIIRGLRHVSDFEFEFQMAMMNYHLNSNIASLFMMPDEKYIHLNSTVVKDVVRLGGNIDEFVPKRVKDILLSKYSR
ncbi:MAG: pantetheine-phosphate adenylyltransferase [Candidatus Marinimicrobia bacterium]|jgi:pantetheine-phosphate adenylyltransferase|nr:pantetheine-phosphate adenylyltransferase [Candidatus Neomarinimicrobiota bacterium]MDP6614259.1 pantetheine-phosphate adenylyltransferase [Candidatus Neomarinimicrobiota bacterium]MDP6820285.1 pantetheine-phosphate adenylyltransferase [Candidatus Neomarinimicrobiota bacterium]MDP6861251.1 pantetheine-phosphate adenylyltransferase [Candidatus Neomarinimicrobiota bacterium]MED5426549.1 pantetheine-phosphate adenylyltransferase [Candidatus Neomarinimicrobiota bacterium]|tara:strand:- start:838 stop:1317 length:480 start_codon:yes stop_codon:yes gene_type:complete